MILIIVQIGMQTTRVATGVDISKTPFLIQSLVSQHWSTSYPLSGETSSSGHIPPLTKVWSVPVVSTSVSPALAQIVPPPFGWPLNPGFLPSQSIPQPPPPLVSSIVVSPVSQTSTSTGLILSPALEPIPPHLLHRIRSGQFLEMLDMLSNHISLLQ